ncbi:MAG: histidine phosphatase family protein [Rhodocyclaceae bacterium]|nr:histidine phosphatase family protein [Rhodocyclaceae bacterium]
MSRFATLCLARHGETDWNSSGILQGWIDVPLNAKGRAQAEEMADALARHDFPLIYTSPLSRAAETADIIATRWGLAPPPRHDGLRERNFGLIQGIPKAELAELNPALCQQILTRNPAAEFEQGETMDEFADRVLSALMEIGADHTGHLVLVIAHGWVLDVANRHVQGLPRKAILPHKPKNMECLWLEAGEDFVRALAA